MADHTGIQVVPMADVVEERFRPMDSYKVFYYEGYHLPDLKDYGESGDIFAFRGIGGLEVERRIFVKTYATRQSSSRWEEAKHEVRHQRKPSCYLRLCPGFPFWPMWYPAGRAYAKDCSPLNLSRSTFDLFFRHHANPQPGFSASEPILIDDSDEEGLGGE